VGPLQRVRGNFLGHIMQYIRIKNWETFQHYKDRHPPWIKLHNELLSSRTWVSMDDAGRVLAIAIMLLASRTDNSIPCDEDYLMRVAYLHKRPNIKPLVECGFIEIINEDGAHASRVLANRSGCSQMLDQSRAEQSRDRAETEVEGEREKRTGGEYIECIETLRKGHPSFEKIPEMAMLNVLRMYPSSVWQEAVNQMLIDYSGTSISVPVRTLRNYLDGPRSKKDRGRPRLIGRAPSRPKGVAK